MHKGFFCNCHHGCQLTTTQSIFCYVFLCLFLHPLWWRCQWYNLLLTSGVQHIRPLIILHRIFLWSTYGFDYCDMKLNGIWWKQSQWKVTMYTKREMTIFCDCFYKLLLLLTLSWTATSRLMQNRINPVDTLLWDNDKWKCWSSLWTVAGGHPVVGSGYSPINISDETSFLLVHW